MTTPDSLPTKDTTTTSTMIELAAPGVYDEELQLTDAQILKTMVAHPVLMERPVVVTRRGVRLCRPVEEVLPLLDRPQASPK